jgi:hypothetical protein
MWLASERAAWLGATLCQAASERAYRQVPVWTALPMAQVRADLPAVVGPCRNVTPVEGIMLSTSHAVFTNGAFCKSFPGYAG